VPELEAFDAGMINYAHYLQKKGLLVPPFYFNLLLGNIACAQADLLHAGIMIRDLPEQSYWSLAGIGNSQLSMNSVAIATGGGVRWPGRQYLRPRQDSLNADCARIHLLPGPEKPMPRAAVRST
jgi:hypothetical protein